MSSKIQKVIFWTPLILIILAVGGVSLCSRGFVKLRIGPFYILEALLGVGFLCAWISRQTLPGLKWAAVFWAPALFFAWGFGMTVMDLYQLISHSGPLPDMSRVLQHSILFVYPLLWMTLGAWCLFHYSAYCHWIVLTCLLTAWPNLIGRNVANISVGPVLAIVWLQTLCALEMKDGIFSWRSLFRVRPIALTILACLPFCRMWVSSVQRSSFLMFATLLIGVPYVLSHSSSERILKACALAVAGYLAVQSAVILGLWGTLHFENQIARMTQMCPSFAPPMNSVKEKGSGSMLSQPFSSGAEGEKSSSGSVTEDADEEYAETVPHGSIAQRMKMAIQHGEDRPIENNAKPFQMRSRRFMWKTALEDWRTRPIIGVGGVPEVPSKIRLGVANTYNGQVFNTPPIAGPHNSYLTVLARTGVIGSVLFLGILISWAANVRTMIHRGSLSLTDLLLIFVPLNGGLYALFNSGFESPQHCMVLWLFCGLLFAKVNLETDRGVR